MLESNEYFDIQKRKVMCLHCKVCDHLYEWMDKRKPNFCPECGEK